MHLGTLCTPLMHAYRRKGPVLRQAATNHVWACLLGPVSAHKLLAQQSALTHWQTRMLHGILHKNQRFPALCCERFPINLPLAKVGRL